MSALSLRDRLQRLQNVKRRLPPSVPPAVLAECAELKRTRSPETETQLPGREVATALGAFQLIEKNYPLDFLHGPARLAEMLAHDASRATAARLTRDEAFADVDLRSLVFLDTETTGLVGGAGTLVFLIGIGVYENEQFSLRQYFLRDPAEEEAMLTALVQDLAPRAGWVTFNGRAFDLPLLESRLILNRQRGALGARPHLDLLMPARRLYRGRLASCSLGHIEQHVFNIIREQEDVPGYLIPGMYLDYLRTRDPSEMHRVIYHNAVDVLSMVTLAAHILEVFATPLVKSKVRSPKSEVESGKGKSKVLSPQSKVVDASQLPAANPPAPSALLRLACWHEDQDRPLEAEAAYTQALAGDLNLDDRRLGLERLAAFLKRLDRRCEAAPLWEQWASFTLDDPAPFVELAKYYEWHSPDLPRAVAWTERALKIVAAWPKGWQRDEVKAKLQHRLERLKDKTLRNTKAS
jgi:uncharacterized protein YprB with RNaseH-like and TPR domain